MPMFRPFSQGFQSETQSQILGFQHHFWVSRKPGNPVISHPAKGSDFSDFNTTYMYYPYSFITSLNIWKLKTYTVRLQMLPMRGHPNVNKNANSLSISFGMKRFSEIHQ